MFDYSLALICGTDIPVPECQIVIHQPTIKEISLIGETIFFIGAQSICVDKNKIFSKDKTGLENTTNFQIFMTMMSEKETRDKKEAVIQLFSVILPNYKVIFTPQSIILNQSQKEPIIIDENNFEILQQVLTDVFCFQSGATEDSFNPQGDKAKEIAEKLMRGRQRIAAEKAGAGSSALIQYTSILTVGINSMSLVDCINLTLYQLYDLVQRYTLFVNWDLDVKTRLAGGKPETHPDNWMKNIH